jgi:hypothetical protein
MIEEQKISSETKNLIESIGFEIIGETPDAQISQSLLAKWLRDEKHLNVFCYLSKKGWQYRVQYFTDSTLIKYALDYYKTYEEAMEAGLQTAIKLFEVKIEDIYISFEMAKLAKEKGFDWPCKRYYKSNSLSSECSEALNLNAMEENYSQPTASFLEQWLREKHNLIISSYRYGSEKWSISLDDGNNHATYWKETNKYESNEEAYKAALQEALKII